MHELLSWSAGVAALMGLALSIGVHPATYGATIDMLARKINWFPRLCWMTAGLATGATVLFVVFQFVNPHRLVVRAEHSVKHVIADHVVDLVVGVLCLVSAGVVVGWRLLQRELPLHERSELKSDAQMTAYFVIGVSSSIVGFTTLPVMYLTTRVVSGLSPVLAPRVVGYLIFLVVLVAPFFVIAVVWTKVPKLTDKIHAAYVRALRWDYRFVLAGVLAIIGLLALAYGYSVH